MEFQETEVGYENEIDASKRLFKVPKRVNRIKIRYQVPKKIT